MRARLEEVVPGDLSGRRTGWPAAEPPGPAGPARSVPRPAHSVGDGVVVLRRTWRFGGRIAELAAAVQRGLADQALDLLAVAADDVSFVETADAAEPHRTPCRSRRCAASASRRRGRVRDAARDRGAWPGT